MSLLFLVAFGAFCGSSYGFTVCYRESFKFKIDSAYNGSLYFEPQNGGPKRTLLAHGKLLEPRLKIEHDSLVFTDVLEKDEGTYSWASPSLEITTVILKMEDCAKNISKNHSEDWEYYISSSATIIEFMKTEGLDDRIILWNKTKDQLNHSRLNIRDNKMIISRLTQKDNGYYTVRTRDYSLKSRVLLTVKETILNRAVPVGEHLSITYPHTAEPWTVTFKQEGDFWDLKLMEGGKKSSEYTRLYNRVTFLAHSMEIDQLETGDGGIYEFRDKDGNLFLTVDLFTFVNATPLIFAIIGAVVVLLGIGCCYCCCCRKKCSKKNTSPPEASEVPVAAALPGSSRAPGPVVFYHDKKPTNSTYSSSAYPPAYPPQPTVPVTVPPPAPSPVNPPPYSYQSATSFEPLWPDRSLNPAKPDVYINPPQASSLYSPLSEVTPLTDQGSAAAPTFSSDEPRFELKGLLFPSAPPLSSDASHCDVYNSSKVNF